MMTKQDFNIALQGAVMGVSVMTFGVLLGVCISSREQQATSAVKTQAVATDKKPLHAYKQALAAGAKASRMSQASKTVEDSKKAVESWVTAIGLLAKVEPTDPNYRESQWRSSEYLSLKLIEEAKGEERKQKEKQQWKQIKELPRP